MKKTKGKNSKKITDFFQAEQKSQNKEDTNEKNNLDLFEDGDLDLFFIDQEKNDNTIKNKKKKIEEINKINNSSTIPSFFINLKYQSPLNKNRKLILLDLTDNKTLELTQLNIEPNNFINPEEYNPEFPFQYSKLININNITYITGGKLNDELSKLNYNNELGEKNCYKLIYNQKQNEIKIDTIPFTNFEHHSHSLLYSQKFNSIILCSGHKQRNCEYLNLNQDLSKE